MGVYLDDGVCKEAPLLNMHSVCELVWLATVVWMDLGQLDVGSREVEVEYDLCTTRDRITVRGSSAVADVRQLIASEHAGNIMFGRPVSTAHVGTKIFHLGSPQEVVVAHMRQIDVHRAIFFERVYLMKCEECIRGVFCNHSCSSLVNDIKEGVPGLVEWLKGIEDVPLLLQLLTIIIGLPHDQDDMVLGAEERMDVGRRGVCHSRKDCRLSARINAKDFVFLSGDVQDIVVCGAVKVARGMSRAAPRTVQLETGCLVGEKLNRLEGLWIDLLE